MYFKFSSFITSLQSEINQLGHKNSLQLCVTTLGSSWHSLSGRWRPKLFIQKASLVLTPLAQLLEHCQVLLWNRKQNTIKPGQNTLSVLNIKDVNDCTRQKCPPFNPRNAIMFIWDEFSTLYNSSKIRL